MSRQRILDYVAAYNADKSTLARFYAADLVFENAVMSLSGAELEGFFRALGGVLVDTIEPVQVVADEEGAALFGRHTFTALKEAELPIGNFKAGESKTLAMFAFYTMSAGLITRIRLNYWPEGRN